MVEWVGEIFSAVRALLGGWSREEVDYYFELAIETPDFRLAVRTNDRVAGRILAEGIADYMRQLRAQDQRRLLNETRYLPKD